ncbi:DUF4783 domain-containing protein [Stygiobacter electus]|uniref:DUF4783 domain-containing protein n=1 Tax=Stygiobacter electus TaxID=3032292 RepID=A0AAE3P121_9BACT|nr:DUF4783 domain-containing protein [Stygiobacter electus]MDF1610855.1 DUF4783 domain-containing protein [Stygiobacter electus]
MKNGKYVVIILMLVLNNFLFGQDSKPKDALKIFLRIEEGINDNSVDKFASYFSLKNYLSLNNSVVGYFSENQSYYILKDYFSINQPISFKLSNIITETANPFASGTLKFIQKGIRKTATIFISLQWIDNRWKISQITVN